MTTKERVINAIITSRLDYCNFLLYGTCVNNIARLQRMHTSAARLILRRPRSDSATPLLCILHWLPVEFKLLVFTYRAVHGDVPKYLCYLVCPYTPTRVLRSANNNPVAIMWKLSLKSAMKELNCNHVRLCGITIQINNCEIMCLNVYMPCDGWSEDDKFAEYMDVLGEIQQLIHTYYPGHVIYGVDMNADLNKNTHFISDFNLTVCIDAPDAQVPYIYVSPNSLTFRIDNFLTTASLGQKVLECAIIDNLLFSDH